MIRSLRRSGLLLFVLVSAALPARAQEEGGGGGGEQGAGADAAPAEEETGEERWFAVVGGEVHTGRGEVMRGATVLARNGRIRKIGYDLDLPPDTKTLDASGMRVYPGLVAISSQGLIGNAASDLDDTIDPFNSRMTLGLAAGITSTGVSNAAAKLKRFSVDGAVLRERAFATFSWSGSNPSGKRSLREKFAQTSEYLRQYRDWEEKVKKQKDLKEPPKRDVDTSVLAVLRGEVLAKFVANDADDLLGIARLAQEYGFRPVIEGCVEGWTVADELGRAGAYAIVTPRDRRPKDEQLARPGGSSIENAAILHRAGVQVAVVPAQEGVDLGGIVGRDIMHLPIEAGFAIRGGLSEEAALESITIVPARMLGVSHRVGSLEPGKDCDLIVTDGELLHYQTFVQYAVVDGKLVYDKEKELFFAHIRPRPGPTERKLDKGETEPKPAAEETATEEGAEAEKGEEKKDDEPEPKDEGGGDSDKDGDKAGDGDADGDTTGDSGGADDPDGGEDDGRVEDEDTAPRR